MTKEENTIYMRKYRASHPEKVAKWQENVNIRRANDLVYGEKLRASGRASVAKWRASLTDEGLAIWRKEKDHGKGAWDYFTAQLKWQKNRCAMCHKKFEKRSDACLDHDHNTEQWRGVLCARCNRAVGYFEKYGSKAAAYLNKWI